MTILDTSKDLSALFLRQVLETPDAVALEDGPKTFTYAELKSVVDALSSRLRRYNIGRNTLIGVLLGRSADYVIACLAALCSGGAFLVLEPAYPPDLLKDVIEDAQPAVIVTNEAYVEQIKADIPLIVLDKKNSAPDTPNCTSINRTSTNRPAVNGAATANGQPDASGRPADDDLDRLAFVSYSSGTTGRPKGIANPHKAAVVSYDLRFRLSDVQPGVRVACNVFFIWEILRPLLRGATVITVPDEASYDPVALVNLLSSKNITETLMTPTLLAVVLSRHSRIGERLPSLRTLWLNGEVVTTDLARRAMKALPQTRLLNCYSCSETHEIACGDIRDMIDHEAPYCPVGPPTEPKYTYILDEDGKKVEPGTSGELYFGGSCLARGYLNLPETTTKSFKANPFDSSPGARMYATGDLARMLPSGNLEITGRVGGMLKVRGYSIVPATVETAIMRQLRVSHCAVVAHGDGLERQVVAYIVRDKQDQDDRNELAIDGSGYSPDARRALESSLAHYMIPTLFVELDSLPTHAVSGKVDLKRLPPPTPAKAPPVLNGVNGAQKEDGIKVNIDTITELWAASLNMSPRGISSEHSFFDLGGHSLSLANLASRLSKTYGFPITLARLAENPTLQGHLEVVKAARDGHTAAVQADLPAVLRGDSVLPDDIRPSPSRPSLPCPLGEAETILLTGTTGFLGAFLLDHLLETTSARIICLVRFNEPSEDDIPAGIARIRRNLLDLGLWRDSIMDRIEVLPGNLSRKRLGLSHEAFDELAERIQVIIHAAATVNLVYPYAALRGANVFGTREILRLASLSGSTVQYISTNGVLPTSSQSWAENAMIEVDDVPTKLADGYGQTKWVAEQLVLEAGRRGIPVSVLRAGTISASSTSGSTNAWDLLTALIVESLHLGYAPDIHGWRVEITPVDFVSKAILEISKQPHTEQRIFHLGEASPVGANEIFNALEELGYHTKRLPWDDWVKLWAEKRGGAKGGDGAFTVDILRGGMPTVDFLKAITVLDDKATAPFLAELQRPKVDAKLLETYARHWYTRGWLPRPPSITRKDANGAIQSRAGPLSGRVAVITGASSGIGAAVAAAFAKNGAHVVLAARRVNALQAVKKTLPQRPGAKVLVHATDVTDKNSVDSLMRATTEELGRVDILCACAGVMYYTLMSNVRVEEWTRTVDVNCKGLLHCLAAVIPGMLQRGKGHIIAISSDAGRKVFPGLGVYSASKFFVEATLQSLRLETVGSGLRVTSIQPGNTKTELLESSVSCGDLEAASKYGTPSGAKILDPSDVADAILYAATRESHVAVNEVLVEPRDEPI